MSRYLKIALVLFYVLLTIFCCLLTVILSGIYISDFAGWSIVTGWTLYCFGSPWLFAGLHFCFARVRRPIRVEEEQLRSAFTTVSRNAGYHKRICLRVIESDEWEAFATGVRTIAISKAMLRDLSPNELEGVMAHELGHLVSHDTIIAAAYTQARLLTYWLNILFRWVARALAIRFRETRTIRTIRGPVSRTRLTLLRGIIGMTLAILMMYYIHYLFGFIAAALFVIVFAILNRIVRFFDLLLSRMTEYRQDAYAQRLGFGKELRDVLVKLAEKDEQTVRPYFIVFNSTHPIIYNRIRRLEQLEDAEDQRRTQNTNIGH
ncbi:MAG: M48 family metalloprotease [Bacteroidetes bacterium]|nr:M48 family metalloprotease [Bacteroidota bacterium]